MGAEKDVEEVDVSKGIYKVDGKLWVVGSKYRLHEHVGSGSYGDVCRATDVEIQQIVALKRIPDVFYCHMLAKRVLREVCIMRRLRNPYIINLSNVFTAESLEVEEGVDLYIATEFADGGDMYHLKEAFEEEDVKSIMWQLLQGVYYLHSCQVWHRDIKSENILLTSNMRAKICDFGLSRSAVEEKSPGLDLKHVPTTGRRSASRKPVLKRQYTKTVVTPSYRAPEVIMSQGQYASAIDIWAVGCIFWELLARLQAPRRTGPPARPLFGVRGEPNTPVGGAVYAEDGNSQLSEQLDVIFNVIGTPFWKDIESVPSESWRAYLKQIPGRAGNLVANLTGCVEDDALDLLSRMLTFDPARRCTAEEGLAHTYFKGISGPPEVPFIVQLEPGPRPKEGVWNDNNPATALGQLEKELENSMSQVDGGRKTLEFLLQKEVEKQQEQMKIRVTSFEQHMRVAKAAAAAAADLSTTYAPREMRYFPQHAIYVPHTVAAADLLSSRRTLSNSLLFAARNGAGMKSEVDNLSRASIPQWQPELQQGANGTGAPKLFLDLNQTLGAQEVNGQQDPPAKKSRGRKKTIIKQGSFRVELNSGPSPQGSRTSTRLANQRITEGSEIPVVRPALEILPRRSPRLKEAHAPGELPLRKRVCLGAQ